MTDAFQYLGHGNHLLENFTFIHQIGETKGLIFLFEFGPGAFTFHQKKLTDTLPQRFEQALADEILEHQIAVPN